LPLAFPLTDRDEQTTVLTDVKQHCVSMTVLIHELGAPALSIQFGTSEAAIEQCPVVAERSN